MKALNPRLLLPSCLALALVVRLGAVAALGDEALAYSSDARAYHDIATNLVERGRFVTSIDPPHTLEKPYANRPPLTPWALAGPYALFGVKLVYGQLLLAGIGVLACWAVYRLAATLFGWATGLWACVLATLSPFWALLAAVPLTESLAVALYPLLALACLRVLRSPSVRQAIIAGAALGMTALNKPVILGFAPLWIAILVTAFAPRYRDAARAALVSLAVTAAVLAPWTIRNYVLFDRVVPVTIQAGYAMYEANNPYVDYALRRVEGGETWLNDPRVVEPLAGLSTPAVDTKARALAWEHIRAYPAQFLSNAARRVVIFWKAYAHPAHQVFWYPVLIAFFVGLVLAWHHRGADWRQLLVPTLLIVQTMAVVALFPSMPRYRVPAEPLLFVFAAYACHAAAAAVRGRRPEPTDPAIDV